MEADFELIGIGEGGDAVIDVEVAAFGGGNVIEESPKGRGEFSSREVALGERDGDFAAFNGAFLLFEARLLDSEAAFAHFDGLLLEANGESFIVEGFLRDVSGAGEFYGAIEVAFFEQSLLSGAFEEVLFLSVLGTEFFVSRAGFGLSRAGFIDGVFVGEGIDSEDGVIGLDDSTIAEVRGSFDDFTGDEGAQIDAASGDDFAEHIERGLDIAELNALRGDIPDSLTGRGGLDFFLQRDEQKERAERADEHGQRQEALSEFAQSQSFF